MSMQWYIIHTYSGFEKKVKGKPWRGAVWPPSAWQDKNRAARA